MSLNRWEQRAFDYLMRHREEEAFWREKVRSIAARIPDGTAERLEAELWRYYEERSAVASPFREAAQREGLRRVSMRNLSEHLLRLWIEPKPPRKPLSGDGLGTP